MRELFIVHDIDEKLPESNTSVLAYVEDDSTASAPYWTIAHFNGTNWIYDVTEKVIDYASQVTHWNWIKFPDTVTVTHWTALPSKPVERDFRATVGMIFPIPTVRYNPKCKTVEIFGRPSPYTEKSLHTRPIPLQKHGGSTRHPSPPRRQEVGHRGDLPKRGRQGDMPCHG